MARNLSSIVVIFGLALLHGAAFAQSRTGAQGYPSRPIRIIVPNTAGSQMDNVTRMIGQRFTETWGQQVIVDDRPGAGGIIGHEIAAKAPPDGYTLLLASSAGAITSPLLTKVPYDTVRDFAPISLVITSIQMLSGHPSVPASNVAELLALARAKPGQLNCGSSGQNNSNHLACEMLKVMGHVDFVHVPFKGTAPQITGIMSGQVQFGFASIPTTMTQVRPGKLRALAQGGPTRSPVIPDVPTVAETLPGFQALTWYALFAPRATPPAIVARVNAEVVKLLADPTVAQRLTNQGLDPAPGSPAELSAYMRAETERFSRLIKVAGLAPAQ
ncbi:MAG TPA: tripartite tricarboxylate transporter substrate binding protein [Burkholderiales bacterium]|nr:tripartite tricarboxylate transporter substrate binding protein [Burkholderiales bacterium]